MMRNLSVFLFALVFLGSGCKSSLFDNDGGSGTGTGTGTGTISICSGVTTPGDAVCNFSGSAGGLNGQWKFLDDRRNRTWREMAGGVYGGSDARVGQGTAVASCVTHPETEGCDGREELIVATPVLKEGSADAAIEYTARGVGEYSVTGRYREVEGSGNAQIRFYRNSPEDVLFVADTTGKTEGTQFEFSANLQVNDKLYMVLHGLSSVEPHTAAVQFSVEIDEMAADTCEFLLGFDEQDPANERIFTETCKSLLYEMRHDFEPKIPNLVSSVIPAYGQAVQFVPEDYVFPQTLFGGVKYQPTFTLQFWVSFPNGFEDSSPRVPIVYDDIGNSVDSGVVVGIIDGADDAPPYTNFFITDGTNMVDPGFVDYPTPDLGWHFYRLVLNSTAGTVTQCIDGVEFSSTPSNDVAPAPTVNPTIGTQGGGANFNGALDDIRVINRALPCDAP